MKKTNKQTTIQIRIDQEYKEQIKNYAEKEYRDISGFIKNAVAFYMEHNLPTFEITKDMEKRLKIAFKDVEEGRVYDENSKEFKRIFGE